MFRQGIVLSLICLVLSAVGCTSGADQTSGPTVGLNATQAQGVLSRMQSTGNLSAFLYAVMTFEISGTEFAYPTQIAVDQVPITWMGSIFNGKVVESGPGEDVTDEVHGSISADGYWVESMYFSEQITRTNAKTGTFFRVTLRHTPVVNEAGGAIKDLGYFNQTSGDVQKYVAKIEYIDGPLINGKISPLSTYLSTDWKNGAKGQVPILKLTFAEGSGNRPKPGTNPGAGM
jgi:hypothetical protein